MRFGFMKIFLFFNVYPNLFFHIAGDLQWCSYKFYTDLKSWFEAKAICEQANMTLAHIYSTQHEYIWSLIPYKLSQMYTNLPSSSLWIGGSRVNNGQPALQDDCEKACTKMEKTGQKFGTEECTESMAFLCQGSTTATSNCYTSTSAVKGLTLMEGQFHKMSRCYSMCKLSCFGIRQISTTACRLMTAAAASKELYNKSRLYVKDLVRSVPVDVFPTLTQLHGLCSSTVILQSIPQDDITWTAAPQTSTPLISESTGHIYLEPMSTPSELDKINEMSTSFLPHLVTNVKLTETSLPTVPVSPETISPSCTCPCIKTTALNQEQLEEKGKQLRKDLAVDKKKMSMWKRMLTSAPDHRQSAAYIGYVGVLVICLIPLIIILMDLGRIHKGIKQFRSKVNQQPTDDVA